MQQHRPVLMGPCFRRGDGDLSRPYSIVTRARQRASKLLASSSSRACASMGSLRFSVTTLAGAGSALACVGAAAGHFNNDFEITVLPAYQHLRPSIRRQ